MSPDARHRLGAVAMWIGVSLAAAGAWMSTASTFGAAIILGTGILIALAGASLKKAYCPRCRAAGGACGLPEKKPQDPAGSPR